LLTVSGVSLQSAAGAGVSIPLPNGAVTTDLLSLDGVAEALAQADVPSDTYTSIELTIADPATAVFSDGTSASLAVIRGSFSVPVSGLVVASGQTLLVKLDVDLESSVKLTVTGANDAVLVPQVKATAGNAAAASIDGLTSFVPTLGTIAAIDSTTGTFALQTGASALPCVATAATVLLNGDGSAATFADLQVGGAVTVEGSVEGSGELVAATVYLEASILAPSSQSGIVSGLDPATGLFQLLTASGPIAASVDSSSTAVACGTQALTTADLANGQLVTMLGLPPNGGFALATRIEIAPERFFAEIASNPDPAAQMVLVTGIPSSDSKCGQHLSTAGVTLAPARSITVHLGSASLVTPGGNPIALSSLDFGRLVRVDGRLAPHVPDAVDPNPCCVEALEVIEMPDAPLHGRVLSVDTSSSTFVLSVPETDGIAADTAGHPAARDLTVVVDASTRLLDGFVFDATAVGQMVSVEGSFRRGAQWTLQALAVIGPVPPALMCGKPLPSTSSAIYVIDVSGSMGWDMEQYTLPDGTIGSGCRLDRAKSELVKSIMTLPDGFLFNLISHDCSVYPWQPGLVAADNTQRTNAIAWVNSLQPLGATGTGPAVADALATTSNKLVILLTDGGANCGAGDESGDDACLAAHRAMIVQQNTQGAEIDVYGVGATGTFETFCEGIASDNGGTYTFIP
jgi:hypothetical protein